jgi:hypothetical protein
VNGTNQRIERTRYSSDVRLFVWIVTTPSLEIGLGLLHHHRRQHRVRDRPRQLAADLGDGGQQRSLVCTGQSRTDPSTIRPYASVLSCAGTSNGGVASKPASAC